MRVKTGTVGSAMADFNETDAARVALEQTWYQLAPIAAEAKQLQGEAAKSPGRLRDPWVDAHVRWLSVFDRELSAVQTVYESAEAGAKLSADEFLAAHNAGEKLLQIISDTRERVPQPA